jgi:hypothetical protein
MNSPYLRLLHGLIVLVPGLSLADQAFVDLLKPVGQDGELLLDLGCV